MSIGLFDLDMAEYVYVPFNLELMKIGDYYKKKGEVVVLSPIFSPFRHSLFYLRKDIDDGKYPELAKYKNIIYGGYAFYCLYNNIDNVKDNKCKQQFHFHLDYLSFFILCAYYSIEYVFCQGKN